MSISVKGGFDSQLVWSSRMYVLSLFLKLSLNNKTKQRLLYRMVSFSKLWEKLNENMTEITNYFIFIIRKLMGIEFLLVLFSIEGSHL